MQSRRKVVILYFFMAFFLAMLLLPLGCNMESADEKYQRLMTRAEGYLKEEKFEEARLLVQSAIEAKPKGADGYFKLAEIFARLQKFDRALENYRSAINYDPKHREARYHLASLLLAAREFEQAEDQAEKLLELNPQDTEALVLKANIEASSPRKNFAEAQKILEGILQKQPDSIGALSSLAVIAVQQDKFAEGEDLLLKAVKIDRKNSALQMVLADLYARQGRLDESQAIVEQVLKDFPKNTALRFNFGEFLLKRGLTDRASEQYEQILAQDPLRNDARDRLYDMYLARQDKQKALSLTEALVKAYPQLPISLYFQGRDAETAGKMADAAELYRKALPGLSQFAPVFRRIGLYEITTGETDLGIQHLNQAIGIDGGDIGARLALAQQSFLRRDLSTATEHINQVLRRFPKQLGANVLRADVALVEGRLDEARRVYQFLIDTFPDNMIGYFKLALLEDRAKNTDKALGLYEKALGFDLNVLIPAQRYSSLAVQKFGVPNTISKVQALYESSKDSKPEYELLLATLVLADQNDADRAKKARKYFTQALEGRPTLIGAYFGLAALDAKEGNIDAAILNYEKLIAKNPRHIPSQMLLALLRERQGKAEEAAKAYRAILSFSPRFGPAANNLAWLLVDKLQGDLDEALRLAEIAKQELPTEGSVADTLGWIHFRRGNARIALPILQEALNFERKADTGRGPNPEILFHLAQVQKALGDSTAAKQTMAEVLRDAGETHPLAAEFKQFANSLG